MKTEKTTSAIIEHKKLADWFNSEFKSKKETWAERFLWWLSMEDFNFGKCGNLQESYDPFYELEWSEGTYHQAARLKIALNFLSWAKRVYEETSKLPSFESMMNQLLQDLMRYSTSKSDSGATKALRIEQARTLERYTNQINLQYKD